jgi:fermentation-respiration switch protein FrsA (DUF1100 family)
VIQLFVIVAALLLVPALVVTWITAGSLVAARPQTVGEPPADLPGASITLNSESGSCLVGWHIPSEHKRGVIVLAHPYQGSRLCMLDRARLLHSQGYSVVMTDLQAHGESPGDHVTIGYLERHDVAAAVDFAKQHHPEEPIGVLGFSMGGAATLMASPLNVDAIVLESVYSSIESAVRNRVIVKLGALAALPATILLMQLKPRMGISVADLRPIDRLSKIGCPVFIMSGTDDRHTTAEETHAMFEAANEPKEFWMVEGADHEDLYDFSPDDYRPRLLSFFERHLQTVKEERSVELHGC